MGFLEKKTKEASEVLKKLESKITEGKGALDKKTEKKETEKKETEKKEIKKKETEKKETEEKATEDKVTEDKATAEEAETKPTEDSVAAQVKKVEKRISHIKTEPVDPVLKLPAADTSGFIVTKPKKAAVVKKVVKQVPDAQVAAPIKVEAVP